MVLPLSPINRLRAVGIPDASGIPVVCSLGLALAELTREGGWHLTLVVDRGCPCAGRCMTWAWCFATPEQIEAARKRRARA